MTEQITIGDIQIYSKHAKDLKQTQINKATKFVEQDLIRYIGLDPEFGSRHCFVCLPLNTKEAVKDGIHSWTKKPYPVDYNQSVYKIYKNGGVFECNCQGWQTKNRKEGIPDDTAGCSHVLALYLCFKLKRFTREAHQERMTRWAE